MSGIDPQLAKTIRRLSWVDILLTAPLAIPGLSHAVIALLSSLDAAFGFESAITSTNALGILLMNTTGTMALFWCVARIQEPTVNLAWLDVYARCIIAVLVLGYVGLAGVSVLFLAFFVSESVGAVVEIRALRAFSSR